LVELQRLGIVTEVTGRERDRLFAYERFIDLLDEKTLPA